MKKILITIIFFLVFIVNTKPVSAQMQAQRWVCLSAVHCWENKPESAACAIKGGHRARLTADPAVKPMPNRNTYIVECVATDNGQICTTGNSQTDMEVYGQDNVSRLNQINQWSFGGMFASDGVTPVANPTMSAATGDVGPLEWVSHNPRSILVTRKFMAMNYWTPGVDNATGPGALQQGSFDFETAEKDCIAISWDPFGRIFDSQSLEPVVNARVSLLVQRTDGSFTPLRPDEVLGGNLINPQVTREDGVFGYLVPDNTYRLVVSSADHQFPVTDSAKIHPNYIRAYSDLYPTETGQDIVQQRRIEHRDIPLEPLFTPTNRPPKLMDYFYEAQKMNHRAIVTGRISHPFTMVIAYSLVNNVRNREIARIQSDKYGKFTLVIDNKMLRPGEVFGEVDLAKVDLTYLSFKPTIFQRLFSWFFSFVKKTEAQTLQVTSLRFTPIPANLDGYAYDSQGNRMPNAKVGIYLKFSNKPYYETTTDANGYYKISSEYLPNMPYEIRYSNLSSGTVKIPTDVYINQNQQHLQDNNVDIYVYKNEQGQEISAPVKTETTNLTPPVKASTNQSLTNQYQSHKLFL